MKDLNIAVIGRGVVGLTTTCCALEQLSEDYNINVTVYYDKETSEITSSGPPGLWQPHRPEMGVCSLENTRKFASRSLKKFVSIIKNGQAKDSGVHFVPGFIMSEQLKVIQADTDTYGDLAINFKRMSESDIKHMAHGRYRYGISFTSVASEGRLYVPWLISQLEQKGVKSVKQKIDSLQQLTCNYDVIFNCSALGASLCLCGDEGVYPVRGVFLRIDAPWKKYFSYWVDDMVVQIPERNVLYLGSGRQPFRYDTVVQQHEIDEIYQNTLSRDPSLKGAKIIESWSGLRPYRKGGLRLESEMVDNKIVVHNYGHGGNGFCLSWETGYEATAIAKGLLKPQRSNL